MAVKLTEKGEELLQKSHAGEIELNFTNIAIGGGKWTQEELTDNISALKNIKLKQYVGTKYAEKKDDKTRVFLSTTFSNKEVFETFYVYEVGVYAMDGETEALYAYDIIPADNPAQAVVQDQSIPQYIPVSLDIGISDVDAVKVTITEDMQVVSTDQFRGHADDYQNPHKVTKAQVGLGNADNTSDIAKPISTATQNALNGKQPTGDYATNTALNNGLAGKANTSHNHAGVYQPVGDYATNATLNNGLVGKANTNHNHAGVYQPVGSYAAASHTHPGLNATDYVVSSWQSGTSWWRKWNSGWIEQGGILSISLQFQIGNFYIPFTGMGYITLASPACATDAAGTQGWQTPAMCFPYTNSQFKYGAYGVYYTLYMSWYACGR